MKTDSLMHTIAIHTIGDHRIHEVHFPDGTPCYCPLTHVAGMERFFCWTLDAALVVSIHHKNKGDHNAVAVALANMHLGNQDRQPEQK
ncbi:MAG: hypothetical protein AB7R40_22505 [Nitrospiraceae bacterium]